MGFAFFIFVMIAGAASAGAEEICRICLDTPKPTSELITGKGGSHPGQGEGNRINKLPKPMFTGQLFYVVDDQEKVSLPPNKGVYFTISDQKRHSLKIVGPSGKSWDKISFNCSEYENGTKIFFEKYGFYSPGWKTNPLPKDPKKCPWHPDHISEK